MHTHTYTHIYTHTQTYTHNHTHTHKHTHTFTHIHIHTYTHTLSLLYLSFSRFFISPSYLLSINPFSLSLSLSLSLVLLYALYLHEVIVDRNAWVKNRSWGRWRLCPYFPWPPPQPLPLCISLIRDLNSFFIDTSRKDGWYSAVHLWYSRPQSIIFSD